MKKVLWIVLAAMTMILLPIAAIAEGELPVDPFSWEQLATIAGATLATLLIVQLLKLPLDKVWKIPTRIVVYFIAMIVLLLATYFTAGLNWNNVALTLLNAVIVSLSAMGAYELTFRKYDDKKKLAAQQTEEQALQNRTIFRK